MNSESDIEKVKNHLESQQQKPYHSLDFAKAEQIDRTVMSIFV